MKPYRYIIEQKLINSHVWYQHWNYKSYLSLEYAKEALSYIKDNIHEYRIIPLYKEDIDYEKIKQDQQELYTRLMIQDASLKSYYQKESPNLITQIINYFKK